jgi:hypothetical protein
LKDKVGELKMFLDGCAASDEVIELALKKCNLNLEDAIGFLITDEGIMEL